MTSGVVGVGSMVLVPDCAVGVLCWQMVRYFVGNIVSSQIGWGNS